MAAKEQVASLLRLKPAEVARPAQLEALLFDHVSGHLQAVRRRALVKHAAAKRRCVPIDGYGVQECQSASRCKTAAAVRDPTACSGAGIPAQSCIPQRARPELYTPPPPEVLLLPLMVDASISKRPDRKKPNP